MSYDEKKQAAPAEDPAVDFDEHEDHDNAKMVREAEDKQKEKEAKMGLAQSSAPSSQPQQQLS